MLRSPTPANQHMHWMTAGWDGAVPGEVLLAVLAADASLVQCTGTDPAALADRCTAERITTTLT